MNYNRDNILINKGIWVLDIIGFTGPFICLYITVNETLELPIYVTTYTSFLFFNSAVNRILKLSIRQLRPSGSKTIMGEPYNGVQKYGMPSAHSQSVFYSLSYLYLYSNNVNTLILQLIIAVLTLNQRWKYKQHTISQLSVGASCGILIAAIANSLANNWSNDKHYW